MVLGEKPPEHHYGAPVKSPRSKTKTNQTFHRGVFVKGLFTCYPIRICLLVILLSPTHNNFELNDIKIHQGE